MTDQNDRRLVVRHDAEWMAELEDRAAEQVDRERLLGLERDDYAAGRAEQVEHDRALLQARACTWEALKERSRHQSDYHWWDGVL